MIEIKRKRCSGCRLPRDLARFALGDGTEAKTCDACRRRNTRYNKRRVVMSGIRPVMGASH